VLGVLEIVLGRHGIAARLRIASQLAVFLGDMLSRAADFDVRSVRLVALRQGIGTLVVVTAVVVVTTAHTPVLSWSHFSLYEPRWFFKPTRYASQCSPNGLKAHRSRGNRLSFSHSFSKSLAILQCRVQMIARGCSFKSPCLRD
jgi:hypothetical protein